MSRVARLRPTYLTGLLVIYVIGIVLISIFPTVMGMVLVLSLPVIAVAVLVSLIYMLWVYWKMPPPRPVFFRMLLGAVVTKTAAGLAIGYLAVAALGDRLDKFDLPLPGTQEQRTAFIALSIAIALVPPIWYAVIIALGRHGATESEFDAGDR